jgi:hypothetical protein
VAFDPSAMHPLPGLAVVLAEQSGVVARWQVDIPDWQQASKQVHSRRWQRAAANVIVAHNGPLTQEQREWVAVLAAGPGAALCSVTAARWHGFRGFDDSLIHVMASHGQRPAVLPGVRVHRTRMSFGADIHPVRQPPILVAPLAVAQAAGWSANARLGLAVVAAAAQQRIVRPADVRTALIRVPRVRHRLLIVRVLGDIEGGAHALTELDAARLCREAGLPEPTRQAVRKDAAGRRRYLDLDWDAWSLAAEIDGRQHMEYVSWDADLDRQNEIVIPGNRTVLRFTSITVRARPMRFVDQVRRALLARGWDQP